MIFHSKPSINEKESQAINKVLRSGWVAEGKEVMEFENEICKYLGLKSGYAVALSSGTAALYVSLIALGVKEEDEVIIPSYLCSAVLNAIFLARAKPILVDVDINDFNLSYEQTKKKMNIKTKAIIVSHTFGMPADIDKFIALGVPVIEDCAQALGATFNNRKLATFGKVSILSFYASKMITTGYGGMLVSNDKKIIDKARDYREFDCRKEYKLRFNFQISDFQAAMGRVQLKKLPYFLKRRKQIADEYYKVIPSENVWPRGSFLNKSPNFFRFLVKTSNPLKLKKFMQSKGIRTILPIETHELLHRYLKKNMREFPISETITKKVLSIPVYPSLADKEVHKISSVLKNSFKNGRY